VLPILNSGRNRQTHKIWKAGLGLLACTLLAGPNVGAAESSGKTMDSPLTAAQVVRRMVETTKRRTDALRSYTSVRSYHLELRGLLHKKAEMKVKMTYQWPGKKDFTVLSQSGSAFMRKHVLKRLIAAENAASGRNEHRQSAITPRNYDFELAGYENDGQEHFYILKARPRAKRRFLFKGRIWVNVRNFAIMRIEGQPATTLSWWTTKVNFVYQYRKVGEFWLPALNETVTHVRIFGRSFLTIEYQDYDFAKPLRVKAQSPAVPHLGGHAPDSFLSPPSSSSD
jgi:hypothetical protein